MCACTRAKSPQMNLCWFKRSSESSRRLTLGLALIPSAGSRPAIHQLLSHACHRPFCSRCINQALLFFLGVYVRRCCFPVLTVLFVSVPSVNLWTMFQAAQKLGGYELVSSHARTHARVLLLPPGSLPPPVSTELATLLIFGETPVDVLRVAGSGSGGSPGRRRSGVPGLRSAAAADKLGLEVGFI